MLSCNFKMENLEQKQKINMLSNVFAKFGIPTKHKIGENIPWRPVFLMPYF